MDWSATLPPDDWLVLPPSDELEATQPLIRAAAPMAPAPARNWRRPVGEMGVVFIGSDSLVGCYRLAWRRRDVKINC
ncbi:hypothetical protein SCOCK_10053 [Actinacidiphila cocklensis]|uniref:Uncharacterized protein n=1 Tax=Actinacidiphila cocklensis TaxID=887465 RepID=A0A9W4E116_9ACTN|nr:hypothetical protein SCOCK_10053 [Actinacidiphila cocklensis]